MTRDYYLVNGMLAQVIERVVQKYTDDDLSKRRPSAEWTANQISSLRIRPGGKSYDMGGGAES